MSYVVLARKYRPQTFGDLVGQGSVSQTLKNALESGRTAHAYIFSGPRGVGKTTTARVLAKCLNCTKGITIEPCNKCDSCVAISQGTSMDDVLEIDGASNRGIEQIRELRENAKYAPVKSHFRIYIIDEAHQITKDAFGALLKTLEEPPAHVVFMMATTEVHKIPAPILSRCQRFSLRPISPDLVFQHLKNVCKKEKIKAADDALKNIVRFVEGSLRDALSLLDQALVFSPKGITSESLRDLLGLLPVEVVLEFANVIKKGDPSAILKKITESIQNGIDLTQLGKDLQNHFHQLLLIKAGVDDPLLNVTAQLKKDAQAYDFESLERNIRLLARALEEMRRSERPRAVLEIYALKMGQKTLDPRTLVEKLEKMDKNPGLQGNVIQNKPMKPQTLVRPQPLPPKPSEPIGFAPTKDAAPKKTLAPAVQMLSQTLKSTIQNNWPNLIDEVGEKKHALASALQEGNLTVSNHGVTLLFEKSFSQQLVARSMDILKSHIQDRFGAQFTIETKVLPPAPTTKPTGQKPIPFRKMEPEIKTNNSFEEISNDQATPEIKEAMKHFPGVLKRKVKDS